MRTGAPACAAAPPGFSLGFDPRDKKRVFECWDEIFSTQRWTDGKYTRLFEDAWAAWNGLPAVSMCNWSGAALAALEFYRVRGRKVLVPTNTFIGTALSVLKAGAEPVFADCGRGDLCLSYDALKQAASRHELAAVWLVHIGGHIAFDVQAIAEFCRAMRIPLLEDCAHAHGASWNGRKPGSWGDAGIWSFYATKTLPLGEGGMLVSKHPDLIEFARAYRGYGGPDRVVQSLNHRITEFSAALGWVQTMRLQDIVDRKNELAEQLHPRHPKRVLLPKGMVSGYYKYIVFEPVENGTSKVYERPCHELLKSPGEYPQAAWVAKNHGCVPLYYRPDGRRDAARA